jgi:hypothetical protein
MKTMWTRGRVALLCRDLWRWICIRGAATSVGIVPELLSTYTIMKRAVVLKPRLLKGFVTALGLTGLLCCYLLYQESTITERSTPLSRDVYFRGDPTSNATSTSKFGFRQFYKSLTKRHSDDQQFVVNMAKHAWTGYRQFANWSDFLDVNAMAGGTVYTHDMALTAIDSLDTLFIMGLHDEFDETSAWLKNNLERAMIQDGYVSFFEITIRALGGLLSAFYLSGGCLAVAVPSQCTC